MSHEFLSTMTDRKAPYKVVCKIGPKCKNHDWNTRSPLKKMCTRGPNCPNHDWDCSGSMRSSIRSNTTKKPFPPPQEPQPPVDIQSAYEPKEERSVMEVVSETKSTGGHSCMLQQTERVHHQ